ncbi:DNA topoisomerase IV [Leptolyngbya sp. 'hensonii']|uniref:DNA gyrase/topoisomerase IV subunit A n=1 Tax=Leptolyngbya sp. 'hensonii' TaxID=1922337 RepID=UPI00094F6C34|nr:DNA topoisomerase (ATP-hydrolyzing) [Leptolyngbya sp. 'hensonii']OLP16518.1 DNA topoisomerase IV [Leptolyngbya sp. 'hensonii']
MAKQLTFLSGGQVIPTALHTEMQQSYLEYAMSVIVGRALPDVRDGLKPVHRRILYAMHELGLTPDRPFRKCARVVGDVLGKYHPHGDQAVYDALVRMVQDFSSRYPLLAGHGNFGSVDDDPPAAMRYTETRLSEIGNEGLLDEIGEATVDFVGNFDNSQQEPTVLPAQLPYLLLNGSSGIAVGMATNVPPHNLTEVVDGLIALIDHPNLSDEQLFELIPGPDFPTGGEIIAREGIRDAYTTGRGSIPLRGVAQMEEVHLGRGRHRRLAIVITELPYQVNKAAWIEKVAELVNQNRLEGIADIRDESDREGMRVVIELKREADPQKLLANLYRLTPLQINFGAILLSLVDSQPCQLSLRQLLQHFLDFRETTLTRQYSHELQQAEGRVHQLEGLLTALVHLDEVIDILRQAPDGTTAKQVLQERFSLSERQADAILGMPLRRLTGMERQNLQAEYDDLRGQIQNLQRLLNDRRELLKALKKDLRALKRKYGDPRRTRLAFISHPPIATGEPESPGPRDATAGAQSKKAREIEEPSLPNLPLMPSPPEEETVLELTHRGYVRRLSLKSFQRQNRNRSEERTSLEAGNEFIVQTQIVHVNQDILVLLRDGKAHAVRAGDISLSTGGKPSRGTPLVGLLPGTAQGDPDAIVDRFVLTEGMEDQDLVVLTRQGRLKRLALGEFMNLTGRGLTVMKLKDDELLYAALTQAGEQLALATSGGRVLRFEVNDEQVPVMSRAAQGLQMLRLWRQERLVGCVAADIGDNLLLVSEQGYAKRLPIATLRLTNRGEIGAPAFQFANKSDALVRLLVVPGDAEMVALTSSDRIIRRPASEIPLCGKDGWGDRLLALEAGETIVTVNTQVPLTWEDSQD